MESSLFPSGDWYGFYTYHQRSSRFPMDIRFAFENGRISACGGDPIGEFILTGSYNENTRECDWIKRYLGAHSVAYRGFRDGKGIWGTWEIGLVKGGFHIWPLRFGGLMEHRLEKEAEPTAEPVRLGAISFPADAPALLLERGQRHFAWHAAVQ